MGTHTLFPVSTILLGTLTSWVTGGLPWERKAVYYTYSGLDLGIFRKRGSFEHLPVPDNPKSMGIRFILYRSGHHTIEINISDLISNDNVKQYISIGSHLIFYVHGFKSSAESRKVERLTRAIMTQIPYVHLVMVDWAAGAKSRFGRRSPSKSRFGRSRPKWLKPGSLLFTISRYEQAASNTRVVGSVIGNFLSVIKKMELYPFRYVHCIGFSLGAHVCGFAGKVYRQTQRRYGNKLDRITGLDPAGPLFKSAEPKARLDSSDARFVDIIHTNAQYLGINEAIGHVDFWVGRPGLWGIAQPDCFDEGLTMLIVQKTLSATGAGQRRKRDNQSETAWISCSHSRANVYFTNSLDGTCKYKIPGTNGLHMGYFAKKASIPPLKQNIDVTINKVHPFCGEIQ